MVGGGWFVCFPPVLGPTVESCRRVDGQHAQMATSLGLSHNHLNFHTVIDTDF